MIRIETMIFQRIKSTYGQQWIAQNNWISCGERGTILSDGMGLLVHLEHESSPLKIFHEFLTNEMFEYIRMTILKILPSISDPCMAVTGFQLQGVDPGVVLESGFRHVDTFLSTNDVMCSIYISTQARTRLTGYTKYRWWSRWKFQNSVSPHREHL